MGICDHGHGHAKHKKIWGYSKQKTRYNPDSDDTIRWCFTASAKKDLEIVDQSIRIFSLVDLAKFCS